MAFVSTGLPIIGWFVTPTINKLLEHGILKVKENHELHKDIHGDTDDLHRLLREIECVLKDAEKKESKNRDVLAWAGYLKEALYDAEDLLDLYEVDLALQKQGDMEPLIGTGLNATVSNLFSSLLPHQHSSTKKKIKNIRKRLVEICDRGRKLGLIARESPQGNPSVWRRRETSSSLSNDVLGRTDVKNTIKKLLMSDGEKLLVLPIVGMAGLGKTTLAKFVFNDADVEDFFKPKVWVCAGMTQKMDPVKLTAQIIKSITVCERGCQNYDSWSLEDLQSTLVRDIEQKRPFLLVLDDAWDASSSIWDKLLEPLRSSGITSRVIVTTRHQNVADAIHGRSDPIRLEFLNNDDMWGIFSRQACYPEIANDHPELEAIGRNIVKRLKGLPLAAAIVGGVLNRNRSEEDWSEILESELLRVGNGEEEGGKGEGKGMLPILMLSYDRLTDMLKQFFSYFSLFPKEYWFEFQEITPQRIRCSFRKCNPLASCIDYVFHQWMSHKFVEVTNQRNAEKVVNEGILELLDRSLLLSTKDHLNCSYITMHDLFLEMVKDIGKEEFLCLVDTTRKQLPKKLRHISFFCKDSESHPESDGNLGLKDCKSLRTLLCHIRAPVHISRDILDGWFDNLRCLRVLSLNNIYSITSLPDSIGNLKLLRYLDLYLPRIEKLPESMSRLYSLQVLDLVGCHRLHALPDSLTRLVNLVRLNVDEDMETIPGIGGLKNLQRLRAFHVGKQTGHMVSELENLNNLSGSLHIFNLENIEGNENARTAQLDRKERLEGLILSWSSGEEEESQCNVLEGLCPSKKLKELSIRVYGGISSPKWLSSDALPYLEIIELNMCSKLKRLPCPVSRLRELRIDSCPSLVEIEFLPSTLQDRDSTDANIYSFPLKIIELKNCLNLKSIQHSSTSLELKSLRELKISNCPTLEKIPFMPPSAPNIQHLDLRNVGLKSLFDVSSAFQLFSSACRMLCLRRIKINSCPHLDEDNESSLSTLLEGSLPSLVSLSVSRYSHPLGDLSNLKALSKLKLCHCSEKVTVDVTALASLSSLKISDCPKATIKGLGSSNLNIFKIKASPMLLKSSSPSNMSLPLLTELEIDTFDRNDLDESILSTCLRNVKSLRRFTISNCNITSLPKKALATDFVGISHCPDLKFDPMPSSSGQDLEYVYVESFNPEQLVQLSSTLANTRVKRVNLLSCSIADATGGLEWMSRFWGLKTLDITKCEGRRLEFPPLNSLKILSICDCAGATSFPAFDSLEKLSIGNCPDLDFEHASFPSLADLVVWNLTEQHLRELLFRVANSQIKRLSVKKCDKLESFDGLPFLHLTSLEELSIYNCGKLSHLPKDFKRFPKFRLLLIYGCPEMLSLPERLPISLKQLYIYGCPLLKEKYSQKDRRKWLSRIETVKLE